MDKTINDIINDKAKLSSISQNIARKKRSVNTSFKKRVENWTSTKCEDANMSLRNILERKSENSKINSFSEFEDSNMQGDFIKKYKSTNVDNFVIEEETGWNQDEENSAKLSHEIHQEYTPKHEEKDLFYEQIKEENEDESRSNEDLKYANEVVNFLSLESKNKLFKVTEEDTNHEKFSITVNSDKFKTNSKMQSELNSLKKKAYDPEMAIKDIYQVDLEKENFKKMIHKDIKLSAHGKYDEMSSSNDAKFTTYKSDMRNKHFNTQVPEESSAGSIKENTLTNIDQQKTPNLDENEAILEKIQESFSDHEDLQEEQNEQEEEDNSSCVRETYTVDSSSDDHDGVNQNDQSMFSDLSQVDKDFYKLIL
jgi:hypothetical protein